MTPSWTIPGTDQLAFKVGVVETKTRDKVVHRMHACYE